MLPLRWRCLSAPACLPSNCCPPTAALPCPLPSAPALADRVLELELIPVQRAINSLAQGGSQLEAGDIKAAASTLRCAAPAAWAARAG